MSESDHSVQVQVGQQFNSLATVKLAMTRWTVNNGQEIKISKTEKKRTMYVCNRLSSDLMGNFFVATAAAPPQTQPSTYSHQPTPL
jgi:hypothetical protein